MGGIVSLAAVFSIVTQCSSLWGGALRDNTKNVCEGDYGWYGDCSHSYLILCIKGKKVIQTCIQDY